MVFPGDNPPPSDPFAPAPPPPGQFSPGPVTPGPLGPSAFQPAPSSGGSALKYIIIGCLAIILLGGIATVGSCALLASKGGSAMPKLIKFIKSEYVKDLTPDHTPEQRARFDQAYDFYADECSRLGFLEWISKYNGPIERLGAIDGDKQITVPESQAWADMVLNGGGGTGGDTGNTGENPGSTAGSENSGGANTGGDSGNNNGGDSGGDFGRHP